MSVCEGFFNDEGVLRVGGLGGGEGGGVGGALGGGEASCCLDGFSEFGECGTEAGVGFLDVQLREFYA